jgi:hypothetical protein
MYMLCELGLVQIRGIALKNFQDLLSNAKVVLHANKASLTE